MPRRDDDIFRKLKNEKPLVKTSSGSTPIDPDKKAAFDLLLERKMEATKKKPVAAKSSVKKVKRRGSRTVVVNKANVNKQKDLDVFSPKSDSNVRAKAASRDIDYGDRKEQRKAVAKPEHREPNERSKKQTHMPAQTDELEIGAKIATDRVLHKTYAQKKDEKKQKSIELQGEPKLEEPIVAKKNFREKKQEQMARASDQYGMSLKEPLLSDRETKSFKSRPVKTKSSISSSSMVRPGSSGGAGSKVKKVFRHEQKYYINYKDHIVLRTALNVLMRPDENSDETGGYHIRSLYFDDIHETALTEKIAGTDNRSKFRIRIYNYKDDVIKLEKKQKVGKFISKSNMNLTRQECDSLIAGDCNFLLGMDNDLAREFYILMKTRLMKPKVLVDYWREAYVHPIENVRVTFDIDLKGSSMMTDMFDQNTPVMPVFDNGIMVLEVKFNKYLPESIKCALGSLGAVKRSAISKYVLCRKYD